MASKQSTKKTEGGSFLNEVEKTANSIIDEVKELFENLSGKVSDVASSAADATASMAEKVSTEPAEKLKDLMQDVKEVGEASVKTIGERFDGLKDYILTSVPQTGAEKGKKVAKKAAAKKKVAKKASKKKAAAKKKASRKKAAAKKKVSAKKKTASKKKVTAKKA
jgi:hypothetical protein